MCGGLSTYLGHAFAGFFWPFDFPGISGCPVFRRLKQVLYKTPVFECPKLSRNLPKILLNVQNCPELPGKCQKCQKYTGIFGNVSTMLKITINFQNFWHIPSIKVYKMAQITLKMVKMWPKIPKIIQGFLTVDFGPFNMCQKCTKIFDIFFHESRYNTEVQNCYRNAWP